ncbi:MAG: tetratricopeptide repeat protein [Bryobacteraceae bacterium]|nr:tetratricopeptide repeat protein [Bryobacteraceae bacterium]
MTFPARRRITPAGCLLALAWSAWPLSGAETDIRKADDLFRQGAKLFELRRTAEAAGVLQESLALNPNQPAAMKLLGLCHQLAGRNEEAEKAFLAATRLNPKDSDAWYFLARQYYSANFFDKTLDALRRAEALAPGDHRIHTYAGLTLEATGDLDAAVAAYEEAIKWNERAARPSFRPYYCYGALLAKLNRLPDAEKRLRRAKSLDAAVWEVYFELGKLYYKQGKRPEALAELQAALKADLVSTEDAGRFYHLLARIYFDLGREEEANKALAMMGEGGR